MAIEAARRGQGVVLNSELLTEVEVRDGTLCEPFAERLELLKVHFLVHQGDATLRPAALALKVGLLSLLRSVNQL